jgi:hypothetical protein
VLQTLPLEYNIIIMNLFARSAYILTFISFSLVALSQERYDIGVKLTDSDLSMPWNGGFNAPQFSNIDLNRDGITDLISFDRQGDMLRTYIHLPASGRWQLNWDYAKIFPPIVDWILIYDYNKDGVEDLFTSSSKTGVAGISVYRGSYQNNQWSFTKIPDRGKDYLQVPAGSSGLTNLYASWDDIPAISDIDGDGDLDVLAYEPGGSYITYFLNQSVESGWGTDSLRFIIKDACWGKVLENQLSEEMYLSANPNMCSNGHYQSGEVITPRHSGSTILAFDQDYDGDKDALIGDISSRRLVFLLNGLDSSQAWITEQDPHFPAQDSSVSLPYFVGAYSVQLDDDPEPEIIAAVNSKSLSEDVQSDWRYDDDAAAGPLNYRLTEKGYLQNDMIDLGSHSRPAVADINGDGLLDLVVGGFSFEEGTLTRSPSLWLFMNEGTATQPYFHLVSKDYLSMSQFAAVPNYEFAPAFGDIDGNGTIDLLVGEINGKLFFYKNDALSGHAANFETYVYPYMNIAVGVASMPQIADINGDGLSDLIVGERTGNADNNGRCSNLNYFQNIGSVGNAIFNPDLNASPNTQCYGRVIFDIVIGLPQYSAPCVFRSDDQLMLMTGNDPGKLEIFGDLKNGITGPITLLDDHYGNLDFGNRSAPTLADLNGDGKYELIVGNQRGGLELLGTEINVGTTGVENPVVVNEKPYTLFPVSDNVWEVMWKDGRSGVVTLFDVQGRILQSNSVPQSDQSIHLEDKAAGMYFIQLKEGGKIWVEKMVNGK